MAGFPVQGLVSLFRAELAVVSGSNCVSFTDSSFLALFSGLRYISFPGSPSRAKVVSESGCVSYVLGSELKVFLSLAQVSHQGYVYFTGSGFRVLGFVLRD